MRALIITVGTEILMGQVLNTNAKYLSEALLEIGVGVYHQTVVGDNSNRLEETISGSLNKAELIILSGGLGPTEDDLTREALTKVLGLQMEPCKWWESKLLEFYESRNMVMPENNLKQALVPNGGKLLPNALGTAPGIYLEAGDKIFILLPGPPSELQYIFSKHALPLLKARLRHKKQQGVIKSKLLRVVGIGESTMEEIIAPAISKQSNPTIAPLAKTHEVHLRITAKAANVENAESLIAIKNNELRELLGHHVYGEDDDTLESVVAGMLAAKGKTLAIAESCNGGLLCHRLYSSDKSSDYLLACIVAHNDNVRAFLLGIDEHSINKHNSVSEINAQIMAQCIRRKCRSDIGLGIAGYSGTDIDSNEHTAGLTYIAINSPGFEYVKKYLFWGKSEEIKARASQASLDLLRLFLLEKI